MNYCASFSPAFSPFCWYFWPSFTSFCLRLDTRVSCRQLYTAVPMCMFDEANWSRTRTYCQCICLLLIKALALEMYVLRVPKGGRACLLSVLLYGISSVSFDSTPTYCLLSCSSAGSCCSLRFVIVLLTAHSFSVVHTGEKKKPMSILRLNWI